MTLFARPEDINFAQLVVRSPRDQVLSDLPLEGAYVADIGAGGGSYSRLMASHGARVLAVEPNRDVLGKFRTQGLSIIPVHGGAESVQLEPDSLDIVTFFHSLHHIPAEVCAAGLSNAAQALKPGGMLYIVEPVAMGPAYLVSQPIDDEMMVRWRALEILGKWLKSSRLTSANEVIIRYQETYRDFDAYRAALLQVDGRRAAAFEANGDLCEARFNKYGEATDKGFAFDAAMRIIVIR